MDDGESILGDGRIKMDKYEQQVWNLNIKSDVTNSIQLQNVNLFISPHEIIHSNLSHFMDIIKGLSREQQDSCRCGINLIHHLHSGDEEHYVLKHLKHVRLNA